MAKNPTELQRYRVRYGVAGEKGLLDTEIAVDSPSGDSMDDAHELAEAVGSMLSASTGLSYELRFIECVGISYIWSRSGGGPP